MSKELDQMERDAHAAINRLREEFDRAAAPYYKILGDIAMVRPHVYIVDGKTMVPILPVTVDAPP